MTAVLRGQFDLATQLLKNNLATKDHINVDGRNLRQIAEDTNRQKALAYIDGKELKNGIINRNGSVDARAQPQSVEL